MEHHKRVVYDILPCGSRCWDVKIEGAHNIIKNFRMKEEAVQFGHDLAKREHLEGGLGQLRIRNHRGRIEKEWTYGKDPRNVPG